MKRTKTIAYANLPTRPPIGASALAWLLLDRLHAAGWVWGATGVVLLIIWFGWVYALFAEDRVDVFVETRVERRPYQ